jgi:serpin B
MIRHRVAPFVVTLVPLLLLAACGDVLGPGDGVEPITELPRSLTAAEASVIEHGNAFGLDLMRQVAARDDRPNVVLSPLSASMALGMTLNGADGGTFDAMRATLGFDGMSQEEINAAYSGLIELLTTLDAEVRFDIANSVWANDDVPFHDAFLQAVTDAFDARVESRDFSSSATLKAINDWVSDNTNEKIPTIVDQLDPSLVMLLINAIYFEGTWTTQFDPKDTEQRNFRRDDGSSVTVDMMNVSDAEVFSGGAQGYSALELPYGGGAFSFVVVLPDQPGDLRGFLQGLDDTQWAHIMEGLHEGSLDQISLPRFKLDFDAYLNDALDSMGMGVAFRPGADFTKLSPLGDQMCISYVRQKTFIEVDEKGTKAAAATAVGVGLTSLSAFIVDRPFVFAIRERLSGTILFMGMVGDPTAEDPGPEPFTNECG